jgi:hypothetical protein
VERMLMMLEEGELFCDPDFSPGYSALFCSPGMSDENVFWLRPQVFHPLLLMRFFSFPLIKAYEIF